MSQIRILSLSQCTPAQRQSVERLKRADADGKYFEQHRDDLLEQYPDQWVAIFDGVVVGHDPDLDSLIQKMEGKSIDPATAVVHFLSTKKELFVL